jgi:hypothetical protein
MAKEFGTLQERDFVRCRLTAMGRDTENFTRSDLFTLFATARVVNFLKGLPLGRRTVRIEEALELADSLGGRSAIGARLLRRLGSENLLFAETPEGEKPLPLFRAELFREVFRRTGKIAAQDGGGIVL